MTPLSKLRRPETLTALSFTLAITAGALLLWLPFSHGKSEIHFIDALFTAASAVCVTGLTVVDTGSDYGTIGQVIILILIQLGGLGIMTTSAILWWLMGQRAGIKTIVALKDAFFQSGRSPSVKRGVFFIILMTLAFELAGCCLLIPVFWSGGSPGAAVWRSVFHSISAFCNAGFSLLPDSFARFVGSPLLNLTVCSLIVLGGIGYPVLLEAWMGLTLRIRNGKNGQHRIWSLQTRTVFWTSLAMILGGAALILAMEYFHSFSNLTLGEKLLASLFQSVTARTAGFNTVIIGRLAPATLTVIILLMFIGGSSGSTAGGIKTTTFTTLAAFIRSLYTRSEEVHLFGRKIGRETVRKAQLIFIMAAGWVLLATLVLLLTEGNRTGPGSIFFEVVSAFGTVGLSCGITPGLSAGGKVVVILTMFVGRVGPVLLATSILGTELQKPSKISYPEEKIMTG